MSSVAVTWLNVDIFLICSTMSFLDLNISIFQQLQKNLSQYFHKCWLSFPLSPHPKTVRTGVCQWLVFRMHNTLHNTSAVMLRHAIKVGKGLNRCFVKGDINGQWEYWNLLRISSNQENWQGDMGLEISAHFWLSFFWLGTLYLYCMITVTESKLVIAWS